MSSRLTQVLLALSLLLNCFVLAGFVYRTWIEPPAFHRPGGPPPGPGARGISPMEALAEDLGLDNSQRQELRAVFDHYAEGRRERFREIQKIRDAMVTELQKPEFDLTKIDPLIEQITNLRRDAQKENMRAIAELATKLKPEQRDKLHKILADRYGNPPWAARGRPPARPSQ
jgi:Spy/CpxP family protein refolding chaperone